MYSARKMLNKEFLSGHYQKTINQCFDSDQIIESDSLPSLIGSLCFSNKLLEAKKLYKDSHKSLSENQKAACRFFLGLAFTRKSHYAKAFKVFRFNLRSLNTESSSLQKFYVYQGLAFYLFFIGKFELSMKWTLKSFDSAMDSRDLYARSLATDLLGHLKIRLGEISVGRELLKSATKLSKQIGNISVTEAIEISDLQYQAQYGYDRADILNVLEKKFELIVSEDNYSRGAIGLELARQYTLRARFDKAEMILEKITSAIFASENRRQEIQLNLRYAENFFQMGKNALAWNYLRSARRCLNFETDKSFEMQILGFEHKLFHGEAKEKIQSELKKRSHQFNTLLNQNILFRNGISSEETWGLEDLFHHFLTGLNEDQDKISSIIKSGYLSLLPGVLGVDRGEKTLYLDQESSRVILFHENKIEIPETHLTKTDLKILISIISGAKTKGELFKHVWNLNYAPERHDNVIHTAIRSLRKNLGSDNGWVTTFENGYQFNADRKFKLASRQQKKPLNNTPADISENIFDVITKTNELNLRQVKALQYLKTKECIDVGLYKRMYEVSEETASRDLRNLKKCGFVLSIGKARAIKYLLPASQEKI